MCTSTLPGGRRSLSAVGVMTRAHLRQGVEGCRSGTKRPTALTSPIGHGAETLRESSACGMPGHVTQINNRDPARPAFRTPLLLEGFRPSEREPLSGWLRNGDFQ